jgi:hypothetical protein
MSCLVLSEQRYAWYSWVTNNTHDLYETVDNGWRMTTHLDTLGSGGEQRLHYWRNRRYTATSVHYRFIFDYDFFHSFDFQHHLTGLSSISPPANRIFRSSTWPSDVGFASQQRSDTYSNDPSHVPTRSCSVTYSARTTRTRRIDSKQVARTIVLLDFYNGVKCIVYLFGLLVFVRNSKCNNRVKQLCSCLWSQSSVWEGGYCKMIAL